MTNISTNAATITLLYFASLREALGISQEAYSPPVLPCTVADLRKALAQRGGLYAGKFATPRCAVNQSVAQESTMVKAGDEVAFFPPVTGG